MAGCLQHSPNSWRPCPAHLMGDLQQLSPSTPSQQSSVQESGTPTTQHIDVHPSQPLLPMSELRLSLIRRVITLMITLCTQILAFHLSKRQLWSHTPAWVSNTERKHEVGMLAAHSLQWLQAAGSLRVFCSWNSPAKLCELLARFPRFQCMYI